MPGRSIMTESTIGETLRAATAWLAGAGLETPRLDAEVLLRHVLGLDRTGLFLRMPDPIAPDARQAFEVLLGGRLAGQPVAYLVGRREFLGLTLTVTPAVLVPRPETEQIVEWARDWIARQGRSGLAVVDVGTGSGAIALGLASLLPATWGGRITAVDVSPDALAVATANRDRLAAAAESGDAIGRVEFRVSDLLGDIAGPLDLILANLPYLRPTQVDGNPDLAAEPRLALDGGPDGLDLIRRLVEEARVLLADGGALALELDPEQAVAVEELLRAVWPDGEVRTHHDLAGLARIVTADRSVRSARDR